MVVKPGTHHAIFVGTTIVVRSDDDRRITRSHRATAVGWPLTRRPLAAHTTADFLLMEIDLQATLLRPSKKLIKWNEKTNIRIITQYQTDGGLCLFRAYYINCWIRRVENNIILNIFMKNISYVKYAWHY